MVHKWREVTIGKDGRPKGISKQVFPSQFVDEGSRQGPVTSRANQGQFHDVMKRIDKSGNMTSKGAWAATNQDGLPHPEGSKCFVVTFIGKLRDFEFASSSLL